MELPPCRCVHRLPLCPCAALLLLACSLLCLLPSPGSAPLRAAALATAARSCSTRHNSVLLQFASARPCLCPCGPHSSCGACLFLRTRLPTAATPPFYLQNIAFPCTKRLKHSRSPHKTPPFLARKVRKERKGTWTTVSRQSPDHPVLWSNALHHHEMALITSDHCTDSWLLFFALLCLGFLPSLVLFFFVLLFVLFKTTAARTC